MTQYLVQNFNQIIDLFENVDLDKNLSVNLSADAPIYYAFLSQSQLDTPDLTSLPTQRAKSLSQVVNSNQRYLLVRASDPTVLVVERTLVASNADMFTTPEFISKMDTSNTRFWVIMIIAALLMVGIAWLSLKYFDTQGIEYQRPVLESLRQYVSNNTNSNIPQYSPTRRLVDSLTSNTTRVGNRAREFIDRYYASD